jgi:hypothetical protein
MKTIGNWSEIKESNTLLAPGIYLAKVVKVEDVPDRSYLRVYFDITEGQFKGTFGAQVVGDKWPYLGTVIRSYKESALTWFKSFITAIEKSNEGFVWKWNEQDLVGKNFVVVFGEEEYQDAVTNEVKVGLKPVDIRSIKALQEGKIKVPERKKLPGAQNVPVNTAKDIIEIADEDLPF